MAKACIICKSHAGSGEHVFPAAFGGKRINRGIYCESHNNAFGRHVAALLNSLDIVNASIGVIPDRKKEIRPAPVATEDGGQYLLTKENTKIAPPGPLNKSSELVGQRVTLPFADQAQANKWIAEQQKAGFQIKVEPGEAAKTQIVTQPLHAKRCIGDEAFMRGVLYLALTFLAHEYPDLARSSRLVTARDIVEKDAPVGDRVLWEPPGTMAQLSSNPFAFGHTVAIGPISPTANRIGAIVSFYGAIHFGVDLGECAGFSVTKHITTHIDPLAESLPKDISVTKEEDRLLKLSTIDESKKYLHQLRTGQAVNPLTSIFQSTWENALSRECEALMHKLTSLKTAPLHLRRDRIMELLAHHDQRVFNLMREGIKGFTESASDLPAQIHVMFNAFVAADGDTPRGISHISEAALLIAKAGIAERILTRIDDDTIDVTVLAGLLGGGEGLGIVLRSLGQIIANTLPQ